MLSLMLFPPTCRPTLLVPSRPKPEKFVGALPGSVGSCGAAVWRSVRWSTQLKGMSAAAMLAGRDTRRGGSSRNAFEPPWPSSSQPRGVLPIPALSKRKRSSSAPYVHTEHSQPMKGMQKYSEQKKGVLPQDERSRTRKRSMQSLLRPKCKAKPQTDVVQDSPSILSKDSVHEPKKLAVGSERMGKLSSQDDSCIDTCVSCNQKVNKQAMLNDGLQCEVIDCSSAGLLMCSECVTYGSRCKEKGTTIGSTRTGDHQTKSFHLVRRTIKDIS